uniref:Granulins domain-containing protein n=1 Tax=Eptatretus burgeri TaxID=7764 RepID=A0A8C4R7Y3_EPTBU
MMSITWYLLLATSVSMVAAAVRCKDGEECPDGYTCCPMLSDKYGCCPFPLAVCCSDGKHCCPPGYTCNGTIGRCIGGGHSIPWVKKQANVDANITEHIPQIKCPDGSTCPILKTCCLLADKTYGCCPFQHKSRVNETSCNCSHGGTSCQDPQGDCLCCLLPNVSASVQNSQLTCTHACKVAHAWWVCSYMTVLFIRPIYLYPP